MGKSFSRELAEWMAKVDKQLSNLSSGNRLDHASLDGTTLYLRDADGNLSGRLGRQPDGSNGVHVVRVQPPPQLTAPILTVGEQAGTCLVEYDGGTFDGRRMPLIHGHTEIWAELVGDEWEPTVAPGDAGKRVGTIRDRTGGEVVVALPRAGMWAVWLRAMGADRETAGPWSPVSTVEVAELVNTENIQDIIASAVEHIEEATDQLADSMGQLGDHLTDLREVRIPQLEATLAEKASSSQLDAISNGVAALTGTNAKTFIQDTEPPPMTGAVTYEWAGTSHASESVKRIDGVEVARNYIRNPSFETGTHGWTRAHGSASISDVPHTSRDGLEGAGSRGARIVANGADSRSTARLVDLVRVQPGKWVAARAFALVNYAGSTSARLQIAPFDASGAAIYFRNGDPQYAGVTGTTLTLIDQMPEDAHEVRLEVTQVANSGLITDGASLWVDEVQLGFGDTEAEALAQVQTYFDGDTPSEPAESGLWINTADGDSRYWWDHEQQQWVKVQDDAVFNRVVADRIFSNLGVFDRLDAREGWIGGVALENGAVKSRSVDTEEFFAATAVIEKVWTDIVRSRLVESQGIITEDMIATGAITTPKLTVTEEMVGEVAKLIRIEAGSLASNDIEAMRIVSSLIEATTYLIHNADGDVSVRLDGMDNFIAGELNTFATPAERDAQLGPNVAEGTTASTSSPSMDWRREGGAWVPQPGAWRLDRVDFGNQPTDDPIPLSIHPELQGRFSRYEVVVRAGIQEATGPTAVMIIVNDEWGSGHVNYRSTSRVERADGTVINYQDNPATGNPWTGWADSYEGHIQADFTPTSLGDTSYISWTASGWANMGNSHGGGLIRSGGRWNRSGQVPITHFGVRPASGIGRTWNSSSRAELWGYR